ncbi:hypothetical protein VOLCADRAFT_96987 [Volvox carteri f. nagariensis]|uniref:Uncharacterized protein n=1 Tax=Volvox carteri f. nagariensis TaxID=3068 RepID=D8UBH6_VOLCA|nr:uncharacterized protein VOLCADRAFT_96987 [Volvox carteri f. nagariensis]EFJ42948.1 hypothetical protein VOLCADRAFT_96987 [Volvox carteri f. nagariensis]|eukprot:XP_002955988.1 hypothetical protein VOLCADRAFT_96987 [Volvox carteri f. nagariensis]
MYIWQTLPTLATLLIPSPLNLDPEIHCRNPGPAAGRRCCRCRSGDGRTVIASGHRHHRSRHRIVITTRLVPGTLCGRMMKGTGRQELNLLAPGGVPPSAPIRIRPSRLPGSHDRQSESHPAAMSPMTVRPAPTIYLQWIDPRQSVLGLLEAQKALPGHHAPP